MNKFIDNWKSSGKIKNIVIGVSIILIIIIGICAYFYYSHYTEQEEIRLAKDRKEKQIKNAQNAITDFYTKAFEGANITQLIKVLSEINISRIPLQETGFNEDYYNCNPNECDFKYVLKDNAIFNSQNKIFFEKSYEPIFSDKELSYTNVGSFMNQNSLSELFNQDKEINLVSCSDLLNYIYSYNSSKKQVNDKIIITSLPENSVASQESSYPEYRHSYGFMVGQFTVNHSDNPFIMETFWLGKPFQKSFLITGLTKMQNTKNMVTLEGKFICKK